MTVSFLSSLQTLQAVSSAATAELSRLLSGHLGFRVDKGGADLYFQVGCRERVWVFFQALPLEWIQELAQPRFAKR